MGCAWLTIVGGVLEVSGFFLVAWDLARVQSREFGTPEVLRRIQQGFRRLLRRSKSRTVEVGNTINLTATARGRARVRGSLGSTLEERVATLEQNFEHMDHDLDERTKEMDEGISKLNRRITEVREEVRQQHEKHEQERQEFLRTSVTLQWCGIGLFVLGAALSVLGNTVNC